MASMSHLRDEQRVVPIERDVKRLTKRIKALEAQVERLALYEQAGWYAALLAIRAQEKP